MTKPAYYYDERKNVDGAALPGVPLRDITDEELERYPDWLKFSIDASPYYRKSKPPAARELAAEPDKET